MFPVALGDEFLTTGLKREVPDKALLEDFCGAETLPVLDRPLLAFMGKEIMNIFLFRLSLFGIFYHPWPNLD